MPANTAAVPDALADALRIRQLSVALAAHGTAAACMATERRRRVVALRTAGLSVEQVAEATGLSVPTIWKLTHRAKRDAPTPTPTQEN